MAIKKHGGPIGGVWVSAGARTMWIPEPEWNEIIAHFANIPAIPEGAIPVEVIGGHQKRDGLWWAKLRADEPVIPDSYYLVKRNPTEPERDDA